MRLIDADELKEAMLEESDWWENADVWVAHNVIDKAPTVVPAKRGKWLNIGQQCIQYWQMINSIVVGIKRMNILISFIINLIFIDIVWKSVEVIVDGHTTTRTVDLIIGIIWALTLSIEQRRN